MFKKIKQFFHRDLKKGNKIVINCETLETRVALLEEGRLEEYNIERKDDDTIVRNIYLGKVKNIEHGLKAMFVDIGLEKNAFLHFWNAIPGALDSGMEEFHRKKSSKFRKKKKRLKIEDVPNIYPPGSEVLVQVTKGIIGTKGPRVTTRISLPGRFLVLMPKNERFGISRKIDDSKERIRLKKLLEKLNLPDGMGMIIRTASKGLRARYLLRDLGIQLKMWEKIDQRCKKAKAPACVFFEPKILERTVRDFLTDKIDEIICDNQQEVNNMRESAGHISTRSKKRINLYNQNEPIFHKFGIQKQIDNAFHRQVWLDCGGYIVIDETEAMIAIDVNTGRNKGAENIEKTIIQTNIEAAIEIARQLRLRNIGGLVVIDFIDMKYRRDKLQVYRTMREKLKNDKAKTQVMQISPLGLMEMTRQRLHESLAESLFEICPNCNGKGKIKSTMTMSVEIQQKIKRALTKYKTRHKELVIVVHPEVIYRLKTQDDNHLVELERKLDGRLTFRSDPNFNREQISITDSKTGEEIFV